MPRLLLAILLLLPALIPSTARAQVDVDNVIFMGRNALSLDDNVAAIRLFSQAIEAKPFLYRPYYYRAYAKFTLGDYLGAEADCHAALSLNPYIPELYELRGLCRIRQQRTLEAIADYTFVLSDQPRNTPARFNRALCEFEQKQYPAAGADVDTLLRTAPRFYQGYLLQAQISLAQGDTLRGIAWVDSLLTFRPVEAQAWSFKGRYALQKERYLEADSCLTRAIRYAPTDYNNYLFRALARHGRNRFGDAIADYDHTLRLVPEHFVARYNRALLHALVGNDNKALVDFDFILKAEPDNDLARYNRALLRENTGNLRGAEADLSTLIARYPAFLAGYAARARVRRNLGHTRAAASDESVVARAGLDLTFDRRPRRPVRKVRSPKDHSLDRYDRLVSDDAEGESSFGRMFADDLFGKVQNREEPLRLLPPFALTFKQSQGKGYRSEAFLPEAAALTQAFQSKGRLLFATTSPQSDSLATALLSPRQQERLATALADTALRLTTAQRLLLSSVLQRDRYDLAAARSDLDAALTARPDSTTTLLLRLQRAALETSEAKETALTPLPALAATESSGTPTGVSETLPTADARHIALADLRAALRTSPRNPHLHYNLGCLLAATPATQQEALAEFTQALSLDASFPEAYFNRGVLYLLLGDKQKAAPDLSRAGEAGIYQAYSLLKRCAAE